MLKSCWEKVESTDRRPHARDDLSTMLERIRLDS